MTDHHDTTHIGRDIRNLLSVRDNDGDDADATELSRIGDRIETLRYQFGIAKGKANEARMAEILAESRPLQLRKHELMALEKFSKLCPMTWTHSATESEIEKQIGSGGKLLAFAAERDAVTRSALLIGPTGIGKSTAAALALRRALLADRPRHDGSRNLWVRWYYARALSQAARQYPLGEGVCPDVATACRVQLLILDDLGLERDAAEIVDVIHTRYENGKVTWTTSGLTVQELQGRYGEAFTRRLYEGREKLGRVVSSFAPRKVG